jgi:hypothetical protein
MHEQIKALLHRGRGISKHVEQEGRALCDTGRQSCLELCAKFHSRLPRELRDMVDDHIIGSDDGEVVVTISQTRLYRFHADRIT